MAEKILIPSEEGDLENGLEKLTEIFGALSNSTRLRIFNLLVESPLCVKDIADGLNLPQSNVSQNLKVMYNAGLVRTKRFKNTSIYYLSVPSLFGELVNCMRKARELFPDLRKDLSRTFPSIASPNHSLDVEDCKSL